MDSSFNLPFAKDAAFQGLLNELVMTLRGSEIKEPTEENEQEITRKLHEQHELVSRITEEKLQKFDPMQLESLEQEVAACQEILVKMLSDIQTRMRNRQDISQSTEDQDPLEKVQGYLIKQKQALEIIQNKLVLARVIRNAKFLEDALTPKTFQKNNQDVEFTKAQLKNYFMSIEVDLERSYSKNLARKEFERVAQTRKGSWPKEMHPVFEEVLFMYLQQK